MAFNFLSFSFAKASTVLLMDNFASGNKVLDSLTSMLYVVCYMLYVIEYMN